MTKLQVAARKRNFCKMRFKGVIVTVDTLIKTEIITKRESNELKKVIRILKLIEKDWDKEWKFLKAFI
jgi:hypothetical protein